MDEPNGKKGSPKWTTTFADLSTLLLTFFVLMLSFASIDIEKFRDLLGSIQNAFGVQFDERGEFQPVDKGSTSEIDSVKSKIEKEIEQMSSQISQIIKDLRFDNQTKIETGSNGVRIRITGSVMFDPGRGDVRPQAYKLLNGIVETMNNHEYYLLVEGHTDSLKISTSQFPSNWELSSARASAVVRYLINRGVNPQRLSGIGHAYNYPVATNKTPSGRNLNRRVEFIFTRTPFRTVVE